MAKVTKRKSANDLETTVEPVVFGPMSRTFALVIMINVLMVSDLPFGLNH